MTRIAWVLTALGGVLALAVWYLFLFSPTSEEIEQVRADTERTVDEAAALRREAATLRQVRESAPEMESQIATAQALLPEEASMPALLRQLQIAADESGVALVSVAPSAPSPTEVGNEEIVSIAVQLQAVGTYFQLIDMTRRLEDPAITARGLKWRNATIDTINEDAYPLLQANLSAVVYAQTGFAVRAPEGETENGESVPEQTEGEDASQPDSSDDPEAPQPIDVGGPDGGDEIQ